MLELLLPVGTLVVGVAGAIFVAVKWPTERATAVVTQQHQAFETLQGLNDELEAALDRCRAEQKRLRLEIEEHVAEERRLMLEIRKLQQQRGGR